MQWAGAYTLRQIDNTDGLSNSAVLSLCQDEAGRLWMGTCDGLNLFDGRQVSLSGRTLSEMSLTGELIAAMAGADNELMWISTNYGLYRYSRADNSVRAFSQFQEIKNLSVSPLNHLFIVSKGNAVYYNMPELSDNFIHLQGPALGRREVFGVKATADRLVIFTDGGVAVCTLSPGSDGYDAGRMDFIVDEPIAGCFIHGDRIFYLASDGMIKEFDITSAVASGLVDVSGLIAQRGDVSDVAVDSHGRIFVAFATGGVVRLTPHADVFPESYAVKGAETVYETEDIGVKGGAFCLLPDSNQDIVWIGSDGNGVYMYVEDEYSLRTFPYADLGSSISRPIRAIYVDSRGTMWLGTKGDGILKIDHFDPWQRGGGLSPSVITSSNSALADNSVYAFAPAHGNGFWIGSDGGLNAVSEDGRIFSVTADEPLRFVHAICQTSPDSVWIATVGNGVYSARVTGSFPSAVRLTGMRRYVVEDGNFNSNFFFAIHNDGNGRILAGNRGFGLFAIENGKLREVPLKGRYSTKTVNDVFAVTGTDGCLWLGTGNGLIKCAGDHETVWNGSNGFPHSTIHALLDDGGGNIWASTNRGLVRLDKSSGQFQIYSRGSGLEVTEFSDGAAFIHDGTLYFGGINGLVALCRNKDVIPAGRNFVPSLFMNGLKIAGRDVDAANYMDGASDGYVLSLSPEETTFTLEFSLPDYIDSEGYVFLYRFSDDDDWIQTPVPGSLTFTSLPHGDYPLQVKAVNRATGRETYVREMGIRVAPHWYESIPAKVAYCVAALMLVWLIWIVRSRAAKRAREGFIRKIRHEQKEKTYEEKLRFFTNITHEFCTPLTLIQGPCERILSHAGADGYVRRYTSLIKSNAERLNSLIQEVIDFRRVETGNQRLEIAGIDVSAVCSDILASFDVMKEQRGVTLESDVPPGIVWPTDYKCFTKIVFNLVSNAFKYTPSGGVIRVGVMVADNRLVLKIYNTGKGIRPEDRGRIFNRYSILDNVEENATRGLSSRNGLGLAICHSMVSLLGGTIVIESEPDRYAEFIVTLPEREADVALAPLKDSELPLLPEMAQPSPAVEETQAELPSRRRDTGVTHGRILLIDDNKDILSLLADSLDEYEVITASNADEALEKARRQMPDLIITDIMMPGTDGLQLAATIRNDRHMSHVPLIILSARNSTDDKVEGLRSGADAYVTKPFTLGYLRAVIARLLQGKTEVREYYSSSASAYQYSNGKLVDNESRDFVDRLNSFIDSNLDNPELSPEKLAQHFQTSTRNLYRKMKDLGLMPPNDLIKDHRIAYASRLLVTTSLTVQEILFRCGFNNRSHFYKEFDRRHGMTPKDYRMKNRTETGSEGV